MSLKISNSNSHNIEEIANSSDDSGDREKYYHRIADTIQAQISCKEESMDISEVNDLN